MKDYKDKKVTVMGLGLQGSGVASTVFFHKQGARVTVTDIKTRERLATSLKKLEKLKGIKYVLGQHRPEDFSGADLIIKGPGVPSKSKYLELARKNKVPIETETGIFFQKVKNKIIGVTGTRGKTTTAQLIFEVLKKSGKRVLLGGNLKDKPLLGLLEAIKKDTWIVLELSSFQLEGLEPLKKSPQLGIITNLGVDHLNRYPDLETYHEAKKTIVKYQSKDDFAILNHADKEVRALAPQLKSNIWYFSPGKIGSDNSVFIDNEEIILRKKGTTEKIIAVNRLKIIGRHRVISVLIAVSVAAILELPLAKVKKAIAEFSQLEHRLEVVKNIKGVLYINDTTATTPQAAVKALASFNDPIILIAGGADKKLDFGPLIKAIQGKTKRLILLKGEGTERIKEKIKELGTTTIDFLPAEDIEEAVLLAQQEAQIGDVVLLSPGCSSFGMFENEFERGDRFKAKVLSLESS